jgi:phospholipase C
MNTRAKLFQRASLLLGASLVASAALLSAQAGTPPGAPRTPIEHVIVIVGENHSFDNVFGAYQPKSGDQRIDNLLSKRIIHPDGTPGPNFTAAAQQTATDFTADGYQNQPALAGAYATLPAPQTTYATGLPPGVADTRYPANLPNGPFQLTNANAPYHQLYVGDPVHRFFQMWQDYDGGRNDLFVWVGTTAGIGTHGFPPPPYGPNNTLQGGEPMGFYNVNTGDVPFFKSLADQYAISDNYHQFIMGGTGANFIGLVAADVGTFNDASGQLATPPANQIENPTALAPYNNFFTQDGYGPQGSYVNCSNSANPGVQPIQAYIHSLPGQPFNDGNCANDAYYLVNNYSPNFTPFGVPKPQPGPSNARLPAQTMPTIADALQAKGISWKYYSGGRYNATQTTTSDYCSICDPLTYFSSVMTDPAKLARLQGVEDFLNDVKSSTTLPAVSYIRPFERNAGHPANATMSDFEDFVAQIVSAVQANPRVWSSTAIFVTVDEGGGYYDSGYIQPIDFFGDGTRIPLIVVSPFARKGHVDHSYADHASLLKFIEFNWKLAPLSTRSRDALPNPRALDYNPYVPVNRPALSDLLGLFDFQNNNNQQ